MTAARTSNSVSGGNCFFSLGERPSAKDSRITATLIRVPWMQGSPPHTSGLATTRLKSFLYAASVIFETFYSIDRAMITTCRHSATHHQVAESRLIDRPILFRMIGKRRSLPSPNCSPSTMLLLFGISPSEDTCLFVIIVQSTLHGRSNR